MKTFRHALRTSDFVVTASLNLGPSASRAEVGKQVSALRDYVDAIQIGDNRDVEGHMSALAIASIACEQDVDCVVHMSCRDRNRIALQADLLGAAALGVTSLVLLRGDKLPDSERRKTRGVFEITAAELIDLARAIGGNEALVSSPGFVVGSRVVAFRPDDDWEAGRVREKIEAGSDFLQTQPCLNVKSCAAYVKRLIDFKFLHRASVIVEVPLLTSAAMINAVKEQVPGAAIPDATVARIAAATDPVAEGIEIAAQVIRQLRETPGIAGVNITCEGEAECITAVVQASASSTGKV